MSCRSICDSGRGNACRDSSPPLQRIRLHSFLWGLHAKLNIKNLKHGPTVVQQPLAAPDALAGSNEVQSLNRAAPTRARRPEPSAEQPIKTKLAPLRSGNSRSLMSERVDRLGRSKRASVPRGSLHRFKSFLQIDLCANMHVITQPMPSQRSDSSPTYVRRLLSLNSL